MTSRKRSDPTVNQIASFIQYVSQLARSSALHERFVETARLGTGSDLATLRILSRLERLTYTELAERLGLDRTTVSRLAARLIEDGLVSRQADAADKRKAWLAITEEGRRALALIEEVYLGYYEVAIADWSAEEKAAARTVLAALQDGLSRLEIDETGRAVRKLPNAAARPA